MLKPTLFKEKTTLILLILTILWMALIFYFSAQPADESSQMSGFVKECIDRILNGLLKGNAPGILENWQFGEFLVRKLGHVTEYFILGVLTASLFKRLYPGKAFLTALIICILYASSDEFHQIFVMGRGPLVTDVLIDSTASAIGILLMNLKNACRLLAGNKSAG